MANTIQLKRGDAADWTAANPTLAAGEFGFEADTGKFKVGNGSAAWTALGYFEPAAAAAVFSPALAFTLDNPNAYDTSQLDQFGEVVAIDGNYAIVGVRYEADAGGTQSGKAYIFDVTTGALLHTLDNPNPTGSSYIDQFGKAVAISGNYAIVGAWYEDGPAAGNAGNDSGRAYIYNVTTGALVHTLNNPSAYGTSQSDQFGEAVAISGNYAIVGAYYEGDAGGVQSGKAYIFDVTTGALVHTLNNPTAYGTSANDNFGRALAISGDYAIVGVRAEDDAGGTNSGKAYIFNVTTGALVYTLNNPNPYGTSANDLFGYSVAISDNYAIVGANLEDAGSPEVIESVGKAYIFKTTTGDWTDTSLAYTLDNPNIPDTGDQFGWSVSISGDYAIVGSRYDNSDNNSGKSCIYNVTTGALLHTLDNPNAYSTSANDNFGYSVAISDNYAIVGAYKEDDAGGSSSGKAYIYSLYA